MSIWSRISEALVRARQGGGSGRCLRAPAHAARTLGRLHHRGDRTGRENGQGRRAGDTRRGHGLSRGVPHPRLRGTRRGAGLQHGARGRGGVRGLRRPHRRHVPQRRQALRAGQRAVRPDGGAVSHRRRGRHLSPGEDAFLERVAEIFGLDRAMFERMRARHTPGGAPDPTRFWASTRARISTPCARPGGRRCAPPIPTACSPAASRKRP
jgi:hypothetical protein